MITGITRSGLVARVFKGAGTVTVASALSKVFLLGTELFLAAYLGASGYGAFSLVFAFLLIFATLCQVGFNFGIVQQLGVLLESANAEPVESAIRVSLYFVLTISLLVAIVLLSSAAWVADNIFGKPELAGLLRLAALILPLESLNQCLSAIFRGLRRYTQHVLALDLLRNLIFISCIPLGLAGVLDIETIFWLLLGGSALGTIFGLSFLSHQVDLFRPKRDDIAMFRRVFAASYLLSLWQILQISGNRLMVLIAGVLLSAGSVGILAILIRFLQVLNLPQSAFNASTPVEFSRLYYRKSYESMGLLFTLVSSALMAIAAGATLVILLNSETLLGYIGPEYASYGWALTVLMAAKLLDVGTGPVGQVLIATERRRALLRLAGFELLLQFFFVVPLIYFFGFPGAVYGNAIRMIFLVLARQYVTYSMFGIHAMRAPVVLIAASAGALYFIGLIAHSWGDRLFADAIATGLILVAFGLLSVYLHPWQQSVRGLSESG